MKLRLSVVPYNSDGPFKHLESDGLVLKSGTRSYTFDLNYFGMNAMAIIAVDAEDPTAAQPDPR